MTVTVFTIWRRNILVWLALLGLLGLMFGAAHVPLGCFNLVVGLLIAAIKAVLVVVIFMGLGRSAALMRLAIATGLFWLAILFTLTLNDVIARLGNG